MSEKRPFFSVIVPIHSEPKIIRKGLQSIMDQESTLFESIFVCDNCTEETIECAKGFLPSKMIGSNYGRAGLARNMGMDIATGDWILFIDDDDWYLPGAFGMIAEELKHQPNIDILAYGFEWKGMGYAMQSQKRIYPAVWNKAWRREFIGEERFPDWIYTDDLGFARKMHPRARFGFLPAVLYHYEFMRPGSVSDKIRNGEYDNSQIPESCRGAAEGYERWLKSKEF